MAIADSSLIERNELERVLRKVSRRFVWFLFLLFTINFVDRGNISMAALTMNKAARHFRVAVRPDADHFLYRLCHLRDPQQPDPRPRRSTRWFARIMITWGIASAACVLAVGPTSLMHCAPIVGIAEAGFAPGLVLYITLWYPQFYRARAFPVSWCRSRSLTPRRHGRRPDSRHDGRSGLAGWQWLFIIEGLPAVILGIVTWFYLTDRPAEAKWLSADERATLGDGAEARGRRTRQR